MSEVKNAIIIFAKYPREGNVKTRLAKTMGSLAVGFYETCAQYIFSECEKLNQTSVYLFYTNQNDSEKIKKWVNRNFIFNFQYGVDLGERMFNAFNFLFSRGHEKAVIIGTDIPDINHKIISQAFEELNSNDIVLGPSSDGGYYLLGLKQAEQSLFKGIEWSTDKVLEETIKKINSAKKSYKLLPEFVDIDREEDLKKWLSINTDKKHPVKVWYGSTLQ